MGTCELSGSNNDRWITEVIYPDKTDGFYVELGAGDWMKESASYPLEQLGWRGVSVEMNPYFAGQFAENRRNPCVHAAIWKSNGNIEAIFPQKNVFRAGVSCIRSRHQQKWDAKQKVLKDWVPTVTWEKLFSSNYRFLKPTITSMWNYDSTIKLYEMDTSVPNHIDAIIIDIEGAEKTVMPLFPFNVCTVGAWIIETSAPRWLHDLMSFYGYMEVENPLNTGGKHNRYFLNEANYNDRGRAVREAMVP